MNISRATGLIGLCARAGAMRMGEQIAEQTVRRGGAHLLLVDEGMSARSLKELTNACVTVGVEMISLPSGVLGDAVGKPGRMAAAITDKRFADRIAALIAQQTDSDAAASAAMRIHTGVQE